MTRPYVNHAASNLKLGCNHALGERTLIVGDNWAGKSTIVNTIELAGTGRASDIAGRATLALDAELATLIPFGEEAGEASVTLSDGMEATTWRLRRGKRASRVGQAIAFPLRDVRDALLGSPETARKWLLGQVAAGYPWPNVLARLAPQFHDRVTKLAGGNALGLPTALETVRSQAREATKRANTLRDAAKKAAGTAGVPFTAAEIAQEKAKASDGITRQLAEIDTQIGIGEKRAQTMAARVEALTAELARMPTPSAAVAEVGGAIKMVLAGQIQAGADTCGVCGGHLDVTAARERLVAVESMVGEAVRQAAERTKLEGELTAARNSATQADQMLASLRAQRKTLADAIENLPIPPTVAAREASWRQIQQQEAQAVEADREANEAKMLAETLATVTGALVDEARMNFEARVQKYMPVGLYFGLELRDGEREVARFGLRTGEELRTGLSGAEWAIVTTALAAAVCPAHGPAVIVPEERAFDPRTLAKALRAFGNAPCQVIVTSPIMPSEVPEGWTVVRVGGGAETKELPEHPEGSREEVQAAEEKPKRTRKSKPLPPPETMHGAGDQQGGEDFPSEPPATAPAASTPLDLNALFKLTR